MRILALIAILLVSMVPCRSDLYAFLTVGSNGFYNYRHQTDICHGYKSLIAGGLPADHIIVMSYDDIPNASSNPFKGSLFPYPSNNTPDVRKDCVIDYKGKDVTPKNWINVVKGDYNAMKGIGTGRVLNTTENDLVFLYFEDHGASGLICFPSADLYADEFHRTLEYLHTNKRYKKLEFFLSACESGSMFDGWTLPNLYGATSANPHQSAYAVYCPPEELVNGKHIGACLGSEFSVRWEQDAWTFDMSKWNLEQQWQHIKDTTKQSEVCKWADTTWMKDYKAEQFIGRIVKNDEKMPESKETCPDRDTKMKYLWARLMNTPNDPEAQIAMDREVAQRKFYDSAHSLLASKLSINTNEPNKMSDICWHCYRTTMNYWADKCGRLSEYGLKMTEIFTRYCSRHEENGPKISDLIDSLC